MRKVWIVVANSTFARIYRAENTHKLIEEKTFEDLAGHLPARDIMSDAMGRSTKRMAYGSDTMEERTPLKTKEAIRFADSVIHFLEEKCKQGECERIYLVAKAPFLGYLREALPTYLQKLIQDEVGKDLTQLTPEQIREYLPPVL